MLERLKPLLPKSDRCAEEFFKTGDWRTLRPEFREKNSACSFACPINNRIRGCFQLARKEEFEKAWQLLIATNPLPAVLGRVCPHPCETECLRGNLDQSLAINTVEKLLGEMALQKKWKPEGFSELTPRLQLRERIAIIGGGPAGLAAAYQLRRMGRWVEIFEAEKELGGMLYFGIPGYRLEKDILRKEIENNILSLDGIKAKTGVRIENSAWLEIVHDFDAVLIAIGNQRSKRLDIFKRAGEEAWEGHRVFNGLDFLREVNLGGKPYVGDFVAVIGGGNTAIDAARMAKILGAKNVSILYRRREEDMPAFPEEISEAKKEGIEIIPLVSPLKIVRGPGDGAFSRVECFGMKLGEPDKSGRPSPTISRDLRDRYIASVETIIVAIGEETDLSFAENIKEEKILFENVFLAGDASYNGAGTVAAAMGSGNRVANEISFYLETGRRKDLLEPKKADVKVVKFSDLNPVYFDFNLQQARGYLAERRKAEDRIREEAARCFSCGFCNQCGNCWLYCPDIAVRRKQSGGYEINYDYCKGCGICANECPRNAIDMEREVV